MIISRKKFDLMVRETEERIRMEHARENELRDLRREYYQMGDNLRMDIARLQDRMDCLEAEMYRRRAADEHQ